MWQPPNPIASLEIALATLSGTSAGRVDGDCGPGARRHRYATAFALAVDDPDSPG